MSFVSLVQIHLILFMSVFTASINVTDVPHDILHITISCLHYKDRYNYRLINKHFDQCIRTFKHPNLNYLNRLIDNFNNKSFNNEILKNVERIYKESQFDEYFIRE
eukprot:233499_1